MYCTAPLSPGKGHLRSFRDDDDDDKHMSYLSALEAKLLRPSTIQIHVYNVCFVLSLLGTEVGWLYSQSVNYFFSFRHLDSVRDLVTVTANVQQVPELQDSVHFILLPMPTSIT